MTPFQSLLYHQWIHLKPSLSAYGGMLSFYWIFALCGLFSTEMAVSMGQIVIILSPLAIFTREEPMQSYLMLLPKGRKLAVTGRYVFSLAVVVLTTSATLGILCLWQFVWGKPLFTSLFALFFSTILALFFLALSLPLLYGFGTKASKPWFFLLILLPVALFVLYLPFVDTQRWLAVQLQEGLQSFAKLVLLCAIALALMIPSHWISTKLVQNSG